MSSTTVLNQLTVGKRLLVVGIAGRLQLSHELGLLGVNAGLALLQRQPLGVPALLGDGRSVLGRLLGLGVGADGGVGVLVQSFNCIGNNSVLDVLRELLLVGFLIFISQLAHVIGNMKSHDVLAVCFSIKVLGLSIISREALGAMRDVNATIHSSLHHAKDAGSSGGAGQTNIKESLEGTRAILSILYIVKASINFGAAFIEGVQLKLLQQPPGKQQASAVGSSIVGQPNLDAIAGELVAVSSANNHISLNASVRYLQEPKSLRLVITSVLKASTN